jgi:hypothetical protein
VATYLCDLPKQPTAQRISPQVRHGKFAGERIQQHVVSEYADSTERGWADIADQWLQPGALDQQGLYVT